MRLKNNQSGSAHLLIVIILVLALLGSLGFIFWQNFIETGKVDKQSNEKKVETSDSSVKYQKLTLGNYLAKKFVLSYPGTWTLDTNEPADSDFGASLIESARIYSPSKSVYIDYVSSFDNSSGYVCGNDFENHIYESFVPTRLAGFPDFSYYEATVHFNNHGYFYVAYLSDNNDLTSAPNANYCSLDNYNIYTRESIAAGGDQSPRVAWQAKIGSSVYMNGSEETKKYAATVGEIDDFLASDDFKEAKNILTSIKAE